MRYKLYSAIERWSPVTRLIRDGFLEKEGLALEDCFTDPKELTFHGDVWVKGSQEVLAIIDACYVSE